MDYLVYEDKPKPDIWMLTILNIPPLALAVIAVSLIPVNQADAFIAFAACFLVGLIDYSILPTSYSIFSSKIKIGFRLIFSFNIPFDTIEKIRPARTSTIGINLPTSLSQNQAIEIVRKKRMAVCITPDDREAFLENFDKAFKQWQISGRTSL